MPVILDWHFFCFYQYFFVCLQKVYNMSKLLSVYEDSIDKAWYDSSNVKYSECIDNDNKPKTLKVVFTNGSQYQYDDVDVRDYLLFREDSSQGKAINKYIKSKGYKCTKIENADLGNIDDEYIFRTKKGFYLKNTNDKFVITNSNGEKAFNLDKHLDDDTYNLVKDVLKSVGIIYKEK